MNLFAPRHDLASVVQELRTGLEDGTIVLDHLVQKQEEKITSLIADLGEHDSIRTAAIAHLIDMRELAIAHLIEALSNKKNRVATGAINALVNIGDSAIASLQAALNSSQGRVRSYAALALGEIGNPKVIEPLRTALNDVNPLVRDSARASLEKLGYSAPPRTTKRSVLLHSTSGPYWTVPVNVWLIASICSFLFGSAAVLFAPIFTIAYLCFDKAPAWLTEGIVLFAVISPIVSAAFGFFIGAVMTALYNGFSHGLFKRRIQEDNRLVSSAIQRAIEHLKKAAS